MNSPQSTRLGSLTDRDEFIIADALATALIALEQLPAARQPARNMSDMRMMLNSLYDPSEASQNLTTQGGGFFRAPGLLGYAKKIEL
jgi:hypothetical protein